MHLAPIASGYTVDLCRTVLVGQVPEEVTAMDKLPLTPEQKHMFFQGNAERIFKL